MAAKGEKTGSFTRILQENSANIREMCNKYKESGLGIEEYAHRSLDKVDKLEEVLNQDNVQSDAGHINEDYVKECLQLYAQVLLDVTFCEENILVDGIFPPKNAKSRVHKLLSMMRQPEVICQHCFPDKTPVELLGEEILECLLWRRGALLYMYCHTVQEDSSRLENEKKTFVDNCKSGALFLKQMLQVRKPLKEGKENVVTNSDDIYTLLKNGVFTETHVLSMIYAGEMCYWYLCHTLSATELEPSENPSEKTSEPNDKKESLDSVENPPQSDKLSIKTVSSEFNAAELGISVLSSYLDIIEGPLQNHCWSSERAKQILDYIEKQQTKPPIDVVVKNDNTNAEETALDSKSEKEEGSNLQN